MLKQNVYLHLENLFQLSDLSLDLVVALLKPDFNCGNNFALCWVDKVTTGKICFSYFKYSNLICGISVNHNAVCRPRQDKLKFTIN